MNKSSRVVITIVIVLAFIVVFTVIVGVRGENGMKTPGVLGMIAAFAAYGAIKAVWKKRPGRS